MLGALQVLRPNKSQTVSDRVSPVDHHRMIKTRRRRAQCDVQIFMIFTTRPRVVITSSIAASLNGLSPMIISFTALLCFLSLAQMSLKALGKSPSTLELYFKQ